MKTIVKSPSKKKLMKIIIFYSWQSTTDTKYNKNFILNCLTRSVKNLKNKPEFTDVEFEIQEGVKGESGSPPVGPKIMDERIPHCDIFIADLSVINFISTVGKKIQNLFGVKYKPFQNNNVTTEYGIAYNSIGYQKIIGILNNAYGSPKDNPSNIPFDISHLRHPIEYKYSKKYPNKNSASKGLIDDLTNALKETAIYALQNQKNKYQPLIVWKDWEQYFPTDQRFYSNDKILEINTMIYEKIQNPKETIRLLGLSGIGKTRILLEAFRIKDKFTANLNSRVLYINYNDYQTADYHSLFINLIKGQENPILIIDNCPKSLHRSFLKYIANDENKISLISINSDPEEIKQDITDDINYILIKKEDLTSIVSDILDEEYSVIGEENIRQIKEFAQGIPLMAVLIAQSIKKGEEFIGKLNNKQLLDKLLGSKGKDNRIRTILKSFSLFNYIGYNDDASSQLEFIATNENITSLDGNKSVIINDFRETCEHFLKREIFEKRGRFVGMRPLPLAMSLTQEWLEPCTAERITNILTAIASLEEPDRKQLTEALAERMRYLGYDDNANLIIEKIVGPNSPFDNAEVLNTELGSRLFRSFVEVNPVAVSNNLVRQFTSKTKGELIKVKEGRRNLVWVLEKLCFDRRTFSESIKILYSFSVAENETWSNNATGQLMQLFNVHLAGTEVDLEERWKIIEWGLSKDDDYRGLALRAMGVGLSFGHASRMVGAEIQGSSRLIDHVPSKSEVIDYWNRILEKLTTLILTNSLDSEFAEKTICNNIRGIARTGLIEITFPYLVQIVDFKNNDWDGLLTSMKHVRKFDKQFLTEDQLKMVEGYIQTLTKTDFLTRYLKLSTSYYLDDDESFSDDKIIKLMEQLADEFISSNLPWDKYLPVFYQNRQVLSYYFGKRIFQHLANNAEKIEDFIGSSIAVISSIKKENRNVLVLGGFINESTKEIKEKFYRTIFDSDLSYLLFYFISINKDGRKYFYYLFDLVEKKVCSVPAFSELKFGGAIDNMDLAELETFSNKLFEFGKEGYSAIFDLFYTLGYRNKGLKIELIPIYEKCIIKLGVIGYNEKQLDSFKWTEIIKLILEDTSKIGFAQFINKSIIGSITYEHSLNFNHYIQEIYEVLLTKHFNNIWKELSDALLSVDEDYIKFYGLKDILGSHIGGVGRSNGVLFKGDIDEIFNWCHKNKPLAPARLAELVPIFGSNNNDYSCWNPITLRLINEFGDIEGVLSSLSSNMGSFSWTGSLVPLLEAKKKLFGEIRNHKIITVSEWAKKHITYSENDIERERDRDEEMFL